MTTTTAPAKPSRRKFVFPSAFTILFILLILIAAATFIIPAGSYDYNADGEPIPGTYHAVPQNPQKLLSSALKGPINGMYGIQDETGNVDFWNSGELFGAIDVALFVLIIGGFLGVTMKTGAINAGITWVVSKLKGKEKWMFPILMTIFAIGGTVLYWAEQALSGLSSVAFIIVTYLLYLPLSFLIPSSSGLATVSMPIMAPLAQFAGVPSYLVVTAFQAANGLINLVTPTSAVVMGGLAIARVGYGVWLKFVAVLLVLLALLSILVLAVGTLV